MPCREGIQALEKALRLSPDQQFPGATIEILGRGFDILHPKNNKVFFGFFVLRPFVRDMELGKSYFGTNRLIFVSLVHEDHAKMIHAKESLDRAKCLQRNNECDFSCSRGGKSSWSRL